jgi:hypothetical protein
MSHYMTAIYPYYTQNSSKIQGNQWTFPFRLS